jgi:hypothetical protein
MRYDVEISTTVSVMQCLHAIGEKRKVWNKKLCHSGHARVEYRYGVALVSSFSRDMWVKPDDGHELAETCRLILTRIYILHTN